jgi:hypothetical protein
MNTMNQTAMVVVSAVLALTIPGCEDRKPAPLVETGTFFGPDQPVGNGVGRTFITLERGMPTAMGLELSEEVPTTVPDPPFNTPAIFVFALPPQAKATPFKLIAMSYWGAHDPEGTGDVPHFHPLLMLAPPQDPSLDPVKLDLPVAPEEVPPDYVNGGTLPEAGVASAPGIGIAYEDPSQPQLQPGWNTTGQNYFFYNSHMNGIGLGATTDFLLSRATRTDVIKQPQVHPLAGVYPQSHTVRYDPDRRVHVFSVEDFRPAAMSR